jgi:hypothetical protein
MDPTTVPADPATTPFAIGADVTCSDGTGGTLTRVIIDPVARTLTQLVVEPGPQAGTARLVPVALVASADPDTIALRCDGAEFKQLESAVDTEFFSAAKDDFGYPAGQVGLLPYYPLGTGMGMGGPMIGLMGGLDQIDQPEPAEISYERVPLGSVQVRRGERVHASDGDIGRVQGLVVDPRDSHVTHVLLQEGHLWGKKEVSIPIGSVACTPEGLEVLLTKDDVRDLPPVAVEHPDWLAQ